ncbi:MAG: OmcA/MtrC family decaheme c-type cytochrome [Chloroflexota bacterium]
MTRRLSVAVALGLVVLLGVLVAGLGLGATFAQTGPGEGLKADITKVEIPSDRMPVVSFRLTDGTGAPLRVEDMDANSVRFILDRVVKDAQTGYGELLSYTVTTVKGSPFKLDGKDTQPALASASQVVYDTGGTFTSLGNGNYTYKFAAALPFGFDVNAFHRAAMQATRLSRQWVANDFFDFVPSGQVAQPIGTVTNTACNACHDLVSAHGGQRYEVELCATCHSRQTVDPESGQNVDFKIMVHKIHQGESLPSVEAGNPYVVVGFRQSVADFSEVALPQDTRNCTTCHNGPQADNYKSRPSAAACGSCHDNVDFAKGVNHLPVAAGSCSGCHPANGPEFGLSVAGAHTIPERSTQMAGLTFSLLGVSNTAPGQQPTVAFVVKDKAGNVVDPNNLSRLNFTLTGPTYEYQTFWSESALGKAKQAAADRYEYTFEKGLPSSADFAWTVEMEGYKITTLNGPTGQPVIRNGQPLTARDAAFDRSVDLTVTSDLAWPRKTVVTTEQCNQCHGQLSVHGGNRKNVDDCVICHNPMTTDAVVRPASANPPVTIDFKNMIHKIHSGENLNQKPYIIYGNRGSVNTFSDVRYPTDRKNCENCHLPQSNYANFVHQGAVPEVVMQGSTTVSVTQPTTAACTGCHDSDKALSHVKAVSPANGPETCVLCHGEGQREAVSVVHKFVLPVSELPK